MHLAAHLQSSLGEKGEGPMRCYRVSPSLCPWQESGASAHRKFQEKKDRNIVHSRKARKWMGRKEVWIEGVARETAGSSGGLSDCRSAGEIKINGAWQISWSVTFTFFFSLLVALFKRRKKEGEERKKTLHRPPSHDYLPSSPPLSLSSRPSSSLMTELLAGDMKAAFSPPLVSTWNGGEGRQALENVKLDSGLISDGILPRFTTFIPLPRHSPLHYFCPPISTCETFIKKLTRWKRAVSPMLSARRRRWHILDRSLSIYLSYFFWCRGKSSLSVCEDFYFAVVESCGGVLSLQEPSSTDVFGRRSGQ